MALEFREMPRADIESRFGAAQTETKEGPTSRALLERLGIKVPPGAAELLSGRIKIWVCVDESKTVAHCVADSATGEITFLAVLPSHEGQGIGRRLLSLVVNRLHMAGAQRIWLAAPSDPADRAYGFYRAVGWQATGDRTNKGDDILEPRIDNAN